MFLVQHLSPYRRMSSKKNAYFTQGSSQQRIFPPSHIPGSLNASLCSKPAPKSLKAGEVHRLCSVLVFKSRALQIFQQGSATTESSRNWSDSYVLLLGTTSCSSSSLSHFIPMSLSPSPYLACSPLLAHSPLPNTSTSWLRWTITLCCNSWKLLVTHTLSFN